MSSAAPGQPRPSKKGSLLEIVLMVAIAAGAGVAAWYVSSRPDAPTPPTSKLAPYELPMAANGPTPDKEIAFDLKRTVANPTGFMDFVSLANAYMRKARQTGDPSYYLLAEQAARRSIANEADPKINLPAQIALMRVMEARHEFKGALDLAKSLDGRDQHKASLVPTYITCLLALGQPDEAAVFAKLLVESTPSTESYNQLGLVRYAQGRDEDCLQAFAKAIQHEQAGQREGSGLARAWLARLHLKRGRLDEARDLLVEADRILPGHPVVLTLLGDLALRQGKPAEAETKYQQAYTSSQSATFVGMQARARQLADDHVASAKLRSQAITALRRDLSANDFGHRRDLITMLLSEGSVMDNVEALKLAEVEVGIRQDPETLAAYGWALGRGGRWKEAEAQLDKAFASGYRDAAIYARASWAAKGAGDSSAAARYQQLAATTDPHYTSDPAYLDVAADGYKPAS